MSTFTEQFYEIKDKKIKKPTYTAEELNSNIAYGMTSENNITRDELNSIQWLCEKSMNDDIKIANLTKQKALLEEELKYYKGTKLGDFADEIRQLKQKIKELKKE